MITPKSLTFSGWRALDVSMGDRETTFTVFYTKKRTTYRINIVPSESRGTVKWKRTVIKSWVQYFSVVKVCRL